MENQSLRTNVAKHAAILNISTKILLLNRIRKWPKSKLTIDELRAHKEDLVKYCLVPTSDLQLIHKHRLLGLHLLKLMINSSNLDDFDSLLVMHMIWSCLSCNRHFILCWSQTDKMKQRFQAQKSILIYDKVLYYLSESHYKTIVQAISKFLTDNDLWKNVLFCSNMLKHASLFSDNVSECMNEILDLVEDSLSTNPTKSQEIIHVMYTIEDTTNWYFSDQPLIERFLQIYLQSIISQDENIENYDIIRHGLAMCLRSIGRNCERKILREMIIVLLETAAFVFVPEKNLLDYYSIIEELTYLYLKESKDTIMPDDILTLLMRLMDSEQLSHSLLSHRMAQFFINRSGNRLKFDTPRIFFPDGHYGLRLGKMHDENLMLWQRHRARVHHIIIRSVRRHGHNKNYLDALYVTIAMFVVEVPCSYTASNCVCLSLALQEVALHDKNIGVIQSNHLHAIVVSLTSLVCYIHKAQVLYDYLLKIIEYRSIYAPFLNPPLCSYYQYAQHHVLWNKSELFLEDWYVRYGLLHCFKMKKKNESTGRGGAVVQLLYDH